MHPEPIVYHLIHSCLQMFIGESWHDVMEHMALATSSSLKLYAVTFFLLLSLLFSQLTVGIIITLYENAEERRDAGREIYIVLGELQGGGRTKKEIDK